MPDSKDLSVLTGPIFNFNLFLLFVSIQVYLCEKLSLTNEMYFAITLDRKTAGPVCSITHVCLLRLFKIKQKCGYFVFSVNSRSCYFCFFNLGVS